MSTILWIVFHVLSFHTIVNAIGFAGAGIISFGSACDEFHFDKRVELTTRRRFCGPCLVRSTPLAPLRRCTWM